MISEKNKMALSCCKSLPALLRGIISNHHGYFYCLNCYHSYSTEARLKKHEEVCNKHDYLYVEMPNENNKILIYNHGEKSLKAPFLITFENEVLLPKMFSCQNNPEKSYTERKANHEASGCAWSLTCSFDSTKNEYGHFRGEDYIKNLCEKFKKPALKIINYEEKEMIPLTDAEKEFHERQEVCDICKEEFCTDENGKK